MKKNQSPPSPNPTEESEEHREQAKVTTPNPEQLYATVNKPRETPPQDPAETVYAPQQPFGGVGGWQPPQEQVPPYAVTDLLTPNGRTQHRHLDNPSYRGNDAGAEGEAPQQPEPHIYEEIDEGAQGGHSPHPSTPETIYAEIGESASGHSLQQPEDPIYEEIGEGVQGGHSPHPSTPETIYEEIGESASGYSPPPPTPETIYAEIGESASGYSPQQPEDPIYEEMGMGTGMHSPQGPTPDTIYAPQQPLGGRAARDSVDPYHITDLQEKNWGEGYYQRPTEPNYQHPTSAPIYQHPTSAPIYQHPTSAPIYQHPTSAPIYQYPTSAPIYQYPTSEPIYQRPTSNPLSPPPNPLDGGGARAQQSPEEQTSPYAVTDLQTHNWMANYQEQTPPLYEPVGLGRPPLPPRTPPGSVITTQLSSNQSFQESVKRVQQLCTVVYGNKHALGNQLAEILDDPGKGERISSEVAENPEGPHKLAGQKLLGIKSPDRRKAEEAVGPLCAALETYTESAKRLQNDLTREQARQQAYERGEHPERSEQRRHHHHHHAREERQHSPEREAQQRKEEGKRMAFAL
ncbi:BID domain-containing T4SS effector [Bartonella jaculi]|uniref:Uncharacterized protein n=1 Tax=Bartonella jaculi TaxID=686226 RepID=A0ABP9N7Y2_9HYPH